MNRRIFFFHGLESSPTGRKYQALSEHFEVESPDFQGMNLGERLVLAERLTRSETEMIVVGSSFGGALTALLYAQHPDRFFSYVLAAPALILADDGAINAMPSNAAVVHGVQDEVVAIGPVRTICEQHGLTVIEVEDEHRLADSLDVLIRETERLVQERASS